MAKDVEEGEGMEGKVVRTVCTVLEERIQKG